MHNQNSRSQNGHHDTRWSNLEPWASWVGGGALTAFGISRRSLSGAAIAAAGGFLIYRAATSQRREPRHIHVQKTLTIMKPVAEVFAFWRNFENLPRIMTHLQRVQPIDNRRSHWTARGPANLHIDWEAEILDERQDEFIVWRSVAGSDIENSGSVQFFPVLNGEGTEVSVALNYVPPAGRFGALFARVFGRDPEQQVREDLRAFKALMEAGEIPTIDGQPSGRRSLLARAARIADPRFKKPSTAVAEPQPAEHLA